MNTNEQGLEQYLREMDISELYRRHDELHGMIEGGRTEEWITQAHELVANEFKRRKIGHDTSLAVDEQQTQAAHLRGLYLVPPHGELIAQGIKTCVVKARPFGLEKERWILVSGDRAYGELVFGEPMSVSSKQFPLDFDDHRVTYKERQRWWPDAETLYLYPIDEYERYEEPARVVVPAGVQTIMDTVRLVHGQETDIKPTEEVADMPYTVDNPPERISNLPAHAQRIWINAFNAAEKKYPKYDEARWFKIAYGAVKNAGYYQDKDGTWHRKKEQEGQEAKERGEGQGVGGEPQGDTGTDTCVCPECGHETDHKKGTPCNKETCSECGATMVGKESKSNPFVRFRDQMNNLVAELKNHIVPPRKQIARAFKTFEANDGRTWLLTWTTNAFEDEEKEIFTSESIADYVQRHHDEEEKGHFWFWHMPGTKFADIIWQGTPGRFLVEAGPFDDTPVGQAFKKLFTEHPEGHSEIAPEGWGTSHGYYYETLDRLKDGVYNWFDKYETTVLPRHMAANKHSPNLEVLNMAMTDEQIKALEAIGGASLVTMVQETGEELTKDLEQSVAFKGAEAKAKDEQAEGKNETLLTSRVPTASNAEPVVDVKKLAIELAEQFQLEALSQGFKAQTEVLAALAEKLEAVVGRLDVVEKDDEERLAEKELNVPRFSWFRASQAAETVLTKDDELQKSGGPKIPKAISEIADRLTA